MTQTLFWIACLALVAGLAASPASAADGRVAVGQEAPDFTLSAVGEGEHTLSALRGEKNAVLVFFRGAW